MPHAAPPSLEKNMKKHLSLFLATLILAGCAGNATAKADQKENTEPENNEVYTAE